MARAAAAASAAGGDRPAQAWTRNATAGAVLFAASLAAFLIVFQIFPQHPWSMLDLRIYLWGGTAVRHSQDPYLHTYLPHSLHFTYTPMAAGIFALLTAISLPLVKVLVVAASVASLVTVLWLTWGSLGRERSASRLGATLAVAALALWIEPVRQTLSFGQVNLVLMLIIVADLCMPDSRWWKGVGVGIAAGFKLTPLIFIPYLLLTRRFRAAAVAAGMFALTVGISFVIMPTAAHHYWIQGLFLNPTRLGNVHYVGNQSLYGAALRLLGTASGRAALATARGRGGRGDRASAGRLGLTSRAGDRRRPGMRSHRPAGLAGLVDASLGVDRADAGRAGGLLDSAALADGRRALAAGLLVRPCGDSAGLLRGRVGRSVTCGAGLRHDRARAAGR